MEKRRLSITWITNKICKTHLLSSQLVTWPPICCNRYCHFFQHIPGRLNSTIHLHVASGPVVKLSEWITLYILVEVQHCPSWRVPTCQRGDLVIMASACHVLTIAKKVLEILSIHQRHFKPCSFKIPVSCWELAWNDHILSWGPTSIRLVPWSGPSWFCQLNLDAHWGHQ